MSIKSAFIPCAGLGTRMGEVGKTLPKPLWPLFDKTLFELQIDFLKKLGVADFYINTHFLHEYMKREVLKIENDCKILFENKLLGSGGSFFNLKRNYSNLEKVWVLNSDVQIFLSERDLSRLLEYCDLYDAVIVCIPVKKNSGYNKVCFDRDDHFQGIEKNYSDSDFYTYCGMGMVNVSCLPERQGELGFFEDVFLGSYFDRKVFTPKDNFSFWDWGTLADYVSNIKKINFSNRGPLENQLLENGFIDLNKYDGQSYRTSSKGVYNFTGQHLEKSESGIYLSDSRGDVKSLSF